jgi:hypothetical protein
LQQRFALLNLSNLVSRYWLDNYRNRFTEDKRGFLNHLYGAVRDLIINSDSQKIRSFDKIRNILLEFTARGHFTQVTQRKKQHLFYRNWQHEFQIDELYNEVNDEVREMHEYLMSRQQKRLENRINTMGAFIGIPAIIISYLGIVREISFLDYTFNINQENLSGPFDILGIILILAIPLMLFTFWLLRR